MINTHNPLKQNLYAYIRILRAKDKDQGNTSIAIVCFESNLRAGKIYENNGITRLKLFPCHL